MAKNSKPDLSGKILELLNKEGEMNLTTIAKKLNSTNITVSRRLQRFIGERAVKERHITDRIVLYSVNLQKIGQICILKVCNFGDFTVTETALKEAFKNLPKELFIYKNWEQHRPPIGMANNFKLEGDEILADISLYNETDLKGKAISPSLIGDVKEDKFIENARLGYLGFINSSSAPEFSILRGKVIEDV